MEARSCLLELTWFPVASYAHTLLVLTKGSGGGLARRGRLYVKSFVLMAVAPIPVFLLVPLAALAEIHVLTVGFVFPSLVVDDLVMIPAMVVVVVRVVHTWRTAGNRDSRQEDGCEHERREALVESAHVAFSPSRRHLNLHITSTAFPKAESCHFPI
jgi:hypothetical protein